MLVLYQFYLETLYLLSDHLAVLGVIGFIDFLMDVYSFLFRFFYFLRCLALMRGLPRSVYVSIVRVRKGLVYFGMQVMAVFVFEVFQLGETVDKVVLAFGNDA